MNIYMWMMGLAVIRLMEKWSLKIQ